MSGREQRAEQRRSLWKAEVVDPGQSKGGLYDSLTPEERIAALARLNERVWNAVGLSPPDSSDRHQWPGQVFEIRPRG